MSGYALERSIVSDRTGKTSTFIKACIRHNGDFVIDGQDIGEAPMHFFGDSDYEYWLTVPAEHKLLLLAALAEASGTAPPQTQRPPETDKLLLDLTEQLYGGVISTASELRKLLDSKNIPYKFTTY